ncbi:MAG: hypothetical protein RIQ62_1965 [Bacteroidota bacterium]|jgi:hypothetical protein|nr:hypothetical protein [Chitinophagales bacterium]
MDFLRTDKAWFGFIFGLIVPPLGLVFFMELNEYLRGHVFNGGQLSYKFIYIMSIACNMLPFLVAKRHRLDHQMQGLVAATMLYSMALMGYIYWLFERMA